VYRLIRLLGGSCRLVSTGATQDLATKIHLAPGSALKLCEGIDWHTSFGCSAEGRETRWTGLTFRVCQGSW
jgi:hypothetical protein